jgi:hypothetical protein
MKKLILVLVFGIVATSSFSQDRGDAYFGLKGGINYANVYDEKGGDFEASPKIGFAGGAFIGLPLGDVLGLQPEILFSQKGYQGSGSFLGSSFEYKRTLSYLDIPVQLQIKPVKGLTFLVGPQYAFLLSRKDDFKSSTFSSGQKEEFENENIRKNTLGFVFGADISSDKVAFGARIGWDVQNNNGDGTSSNPRFKNQWIQLTLGFIL